MLLCLLGGRKTGWYAWSAYRVPVFATGNLYVSSSLTTSTGSRSIVRMMFVSSTSEIENTASTHGFTCSGTKLCCIVEYQLGSAFMVYMSSLIVSLCLYSRRSLILVLSPFHSQFYLQHALFYE